MPIEHGNFQQMYINVDMFKKAGLNPDNPPKTFDVWLADMKKLTIADPKGGDPTQVGFAIRSKGAPVGITDKFLPFAHAWGARMLSPEMDKASGYANSPQMVAALTFFGDLVLKDKVASLAFGNPEDAFGQQVAWEFFRFISNAKDDMDHHQLQGILPVWTANLDSTYVKARPDFQSTKDMLAQPVPPTYFHPKSNELATAFGEAVVGVLFGKGQPKPLLDEAAAKMDRILKD
jgi:ABC-type glycerol-3-phosphate transport system substrate-binding protein